jgi:inner membrane protein
MTGKGHLATGIAFSFSTFLFTKDLGAIGWISAIFCIIGVNSPDYLEIQHKYGTLIPHRTITHWIPIWLCLFFYSIFCIDPNYFSFLNDFNLYKLGNLEASALLGFSIGGLLHLLFDLPNPMGVPLLLPWKRVSLNLWLSGKFEKLITAFVALITISYSIFYFNLEEYFLALFHFFY